MFKIQELNKCEGYNIVTFTDDQEAYGSLLIMEEEGLYIEFMEFDGEDLRVITEEGTPEDELGE